MCVCVCACVCVSVCVCVCLCISGSRTAEPSPQGSPTLGQQSSTSEDIWVLRKPLAGKLTCVFAGNNVKLLVLDITLRACVCVFVCGGGERSGSVGSLGSARSSSSLQGSGNTHVLTTPAPSPHPANTPGVNTHGLNAPGLHAQAEGVKVRIVLAFICAHLYRAKSTTFLGNSRTFSGSPGLPSELTTTVFPAHFAGNLERSATSSVLDQSVSRSGALSRWPPGFLSLT